MQGQINGVALELATAAGGRLPVLVTSTLKTGTNGQPLLIRTGNHEFIRDVPRSEKRLAVVERQQRAFKTGNHDGMIR